MKLQRRVFIQTTGGSLAALLAGCSQRGDMQSNIVLILADDLGWNQVGYNGSRYYETPNIDRIAASGMQFTEAYSAAPVCSPTRASLMTGKAPARLHLTDYIPGNPFPYARLSTPRQIPCLPLEETTLPERLKEAGYVTGHFGKWHLSTDYSYQPGRPFDPASQGFDEVYTCAKPDSDADPEADAHHVAEVTRRSLSFIATKRDRPFFCYIGHHVPHRPLLERADLIAKYRAKPGADQPTSNPVLAAMMERMDSGIGQVLAKLDELGIAGQTLVVFASDNGGLQLSQRQDPFRGGKATVFEGGLRVPFAIRWPSVVRPGARCDEPVTSTDIFATLLEVAGLPAHEAQSLDGESLVPLLRQVGKPKREALFWHYPHYHEQGFRPAGAVRQGDFKLIEWYEETLLGLEKQVSLYNLREDKGETRDLAMDMPEKAAEMRRRLREWRKAVAAQEMTINPDYDPARESLSRGN